MTFSMRVFLGLVFCIQLVRPEYKIQSVVGLKEESSTPKSYIIDELLFEGQDGNGEESGGAEYEGDEEDDYDDESDHENEVDEENGTQENNLDEELPDIISVNATEFPEVGLLGEESKGMGKDVPVVTGYACNDYKVMDKDHSTLKMKVYSDSKHWKITYLDPAQSLSVRDAEGLKRRVKPCLKDYKKWLKTKDRRRRRIRRKIRRVKKALHSLHRKLEWCEQHGKHCKLKLVEKIARKRKRYQLLRRRYKRAKYYHPKRTYVSKIPIDFRAPVRLIQTPLKDKKSLLSPDAVVSIEYTKKDVQYFLAVPTKTKPSWLHKRNWVATGGKLKIKHSNTKEVVEFDFYEKTVRADEILTLEALCDCKEKACPVNYVLFYRILKSSLDSLLPSTRDTCTCWAWDDPHINDFDKKRFDLGGRWLDAIRTQDCSFRVQTYAIRHNSITRYMAIQIENSVIGFDFVRFQLSKTNPNYNYYTTKNQGRANWWRTKDKALPLLRIKHIDASDGTQLIAKNHNHYIVKNDRLGIEIIVLHNAKYTINIRGQVVKERTGFGYCGSCGKTHSVVHGQNAAAMCGGAYHSDEKATKYAVPKDQIIWDIFDRKLAYPSKYLPGKKLVCHKHFCKNEIQKLELGDPSIPPTELCYAATCKVPPPKCDARKECKAKGRSEAYWERALEECGVETAKIPGEMGCDCLKDLCHCPADIPEDECFTPPELDSCQLSAPCPPEEALKEAVITAGKYQYATMDFANPKDPESNQCSTQEYTHPPHEWEIVPGTDKSIDGYLILHPEIKFGAKCLYKSDGSGIGDCNAKYFVATSEKTCYKLKKCGSRILIRRKKPSAELTCDKKQVTFRAKKNEVDLSGSIAHSSIKNSIMFNAGGINYYKFNSSNEMPKMTYDTLSGLFKRFYDAIVKADKSRFVISIFRSEPENNLYVCGVGANLGKKDSYLTTLIQHINPGFVLKWEGSSKYGYNDFDYYNPVYSGEALEATNYFLYENILSAVHGWCVGKLNIQRGGGIKLTFSNLDGIDEIAILSDTSSDPVTKNFQDFHTHPLDETTDQLVMELHPQCPATTS